MAVRASIRSNLYKDSVALMRIAEQMLTGTGVHRATLLMGTEANKAILRDAGLMSTELDAARPADLMVLVEDDSAEKLDAAMAIAEAGLAGNLRAVAAGSAEEVAPKSLSDALFDLAANDRPGIAQVSVPGPYAAAEALKALARGMDVFLFSDNVPLDQERAVKLAASQRGRLVMGPDCGTAIIGGVPLGFANVVRRGRIGLVAASGTGLQEVTCRIDALGEGVSHAIGTGGRDVSAEVGGISMLAGLDLLAADEGTGVIVIVSKPPAPAVSAEVLKRAAGAGKPVVVLFLGAPAQAVSGPLQFVANLDDAARAAVAALRGKPAAAANEDAQDLSALALRFAPGQRFLRALYSGGTFCSESQVIWREAGIAVASNVPLDKKLKLADARRLPGAAGTPAMEHVALDMGEDEFTVGKPHPMIDMSGRIERLLAEARDPSVAVLLLDVVLGHGAHADPAGALAPAIREARDIAARDGRTLAVLAFVTGTGADPQGLAGQREALADAGAVLASSSTSAARMAARLVAAAGSNAVSGTPTGARAGAAVRG